MAQFNVYAGARYALLDCQSDFLPIDTRLMVPLYPRIEIVNLIRRLNPIFVVNGSELVMMTQMAAALAPKSIGKPIASLIAEQDAIKAAIDMLLSGF